MPWLCTPAPRGRSLPRRRTLTRRKRRKGEGWRNAACRWEERVSWTGGMRERGGNLVIPGRILCLWRDECSGFGETFVRAKKRTVSPKHALLLAHEMARDMSIFLTGNRTEIKARACVSGAERPCWLSGVKMYRHIVTVSVNSSYRPHPAVDMRGSGTTLLHTDVSLN